MPRVRLKLEIGYLLTHEFFCIINFADLRFQLFEGAVRPAAVGDILAAGRRMRQATASTIGHRKRI